MSNDLVSQESKEVMLAAKNDFFAEISGEDYSVPFIRVLADLSAVVKDGTFKSGMIYNTGTGEAVEEMNVVPLKKVEKTITVKTTMGEFVASYPFSLEKLGELTVKQDGLKRWDKDDNLVFETLNYYLMDADSFDVVICSMLSTNYSVGKAWNTRIRMNQKFGPYESVWNITTKETPKGKASYWKFSVPRFIGKVTEEQAEMVAASQAMLSSAKVDHSKGFESDIIDDSESDY